MATTAITFALTGVQSYTVPANKLLITRVSDLGGGSGFGVLVNGVTAGITSPLVANAGQTITTVSTANTIGFNGLLFDA
jgi:hypothetical protein